MFILPAYPVAIRQRVRYDSASGLLFLRNNPRSRFGNAADVFAVCADVLDGSRILQLSVMTQQHDENIALRAIEQAFDVFLHDSGIRDPKTVANIRALSSAIVSAFMNERAINRRNVIENVALMRGDLSRLIDKIDLMQETISGRVHSLSNHMMGIETRFGEVTDLIIALHDANVTNIDDATVEQIREIERS